MNFITNAINSLGITTQTIQDLYATKDAFNKTTETLCNMQPGSRSMRVWMDGALYDKSESSLISTKSFYDRGYTIECLESYVVEAEKMLSEGVDPEQKEKIFQALLNIHEYVKHPERKEEFGEGKVQKNRWVSPLGGERSFKSEEVGERLGVLSGACQHMMSDHAQPLFESFVKKGLYEECKRVTEIVLAKDEGFNPSLIKGVYALRQELLGQEKQMNRTVDVLKHGSNTNEPEANQKIIHLRSAYAAILNQVRDRVIAVAEKSQQLDELYVASCLEDPIIDQCLKPKPAKEEKDLFKFIGGLINKPVSQESITYTAYALNPALQKDRIADLALKVNQKVDVIHTLGELFGQPQIQQWNNHSWVVTWSPKGEGGFNQVFSGVWIGPTYTGRVVIRKPNETEIEFTAQEFDRYKDIKGIVGIVPIMEHDSRTGTMLMKECDTDLGHLANLSLEEKVSIVDQLLHTMKALHRKGYCHQDIKPGNIFIDYFPRTDGARDIQTFFGDFGALGKTGEKEGFAGSFPYFPWHELRVDISVNNKGHLSNHPTRDLFALGISLLELSDGYPVELEQWVKKHQRAIQHHLVEGTISNYMRGIVLQEYREKLAALTDRIAASDIPLRDVILDLIMGKDIALAQDHLNELK